MAVEELARHAPDFCCHGKADQGIEQSLDDGVLGGPCACPQFGYADGRTKDLLAWSISFSQPSHFFLRTGCAAGLITAADEVTHGLDASLVVAEISVANRLADQLRDGSVLGFGLNVQSIPELIVEVKLGSPHEV